MPGVAAVSTYDWRRYDDEHVMSDVSREVEPIRLKRGYVEAGPGFFATLGTPLLAGRDFSEGDRDRGAIILSKRAAALLFPHGDAIGRMVKLGGERSTRPWLPVIGIARDIKFDYTPDPNATADTAVYATTPGRLFDYSDLLVRPTRENPALSVSILRAMRDGLPPRAFTQVAPCAIVSSSNRSSRS
jgi:hypothetical protein